MGSRCKGKISWSSLFIVMYLCQGHASLYQGHASLNSWFNQVRSSVRSTVSRIYSEHYLEQLRMHGTSVCLLETLILHVHACRHYFYIDVCLSVCLSLWHKLLKYLSYEFYLYRQEIQIDYIFSLVCLWIFFSLFGLHVMNHLLRNFKLLHNIWGQVWVPRSLSEGQYQRKKNLTSVLTKYVQWGLARRSRPSQGHLKVKV